MRTAFQRLQIKGGHSPGCVPRPRSRLFFRQTSRPSRNRRNGWGVWNSHSTSKGKPGRLAPEGEALQALRGVQFTVAVTTAAALGDLTRFENPRQLMNDLGLTPSGYSRGGRRQQGSI